MAKSSDKEKIFKAAREKETVVYKRNPIRLSVDFSAETVQATREWYDIFKAPKAKNLQSSILYPARLSFRRKGKRQFPKQKLKEFMTTKPALQKILKRTFFSRK